MSSLSPSLAVIATRSDILRSSSAVTECAYSPPLGRRFNHLPRITEGWGLARKELRFSAIAGGGCWQARTATAVPSFVPRSGVSPSEASQVSPCRLPGFSKGFAEPRFAPREGIEPPNVARFVVRLRGLLISFLPFRTLSSEWFTRTVSWIRQGSNLQPSASDADALPVELPIRRGLLPGAVFPRCQSLVGMA